MTRPDMTVREVEQRRNNAGDSEEAARLLAEAANHRGTP